MYFCHRHYITWFHPNQLCICRDNRVRDISDNRRHRDIICVFAQWQSCEIKNHTMTYLVGVLRLQIWRFYLWFKHPTSSFLRCLGFVTLESITPVPAVCDTVFFCDITILQSVSRSVWDYITKSRDLEFYTYIQDMAIDNDIETIMFAFMFVKKIRTSGQEKRN